MINPTVADYESAWNRLRRLRMWRSVIFPMVIATWLVMLLARDVGRVVDDRACSHCGLKRYEMPAQLGGVSSG